MYACVCMCTVRICACMQCVGVMYVCNVRMQVHLAVACAFACVYFFGSGTHVCMCACMYACMCVCVFAHMCDCMYVMECHVM